MIIAAWVYKADFFQAMPFGSPGKEKVNLNLDSLWSGGPFEVSNYTGGNPTSEKGDYLAGIRDWIFQNGTGSRRALSFDLLKC